MSSTLSEIRAAVAAFAIATLGLVFAAPRSAAQTPDPATAQTPDPATAQTTDPSTDRRVRAALHTIKSSNAWTLDQQRSICEISAPPFKETARGAELKRRFEALGLDSVRVDAVGNVIAERRGAGTGPTVVLAGHLDTVFPEGTDVKVKRQGTRMTAPGIADDCRGLAVLLAVARAFQRSGIRTVGTVYFVGDVGEEGPGNLRGMRHLFGTELAGKVDYFISVDDAGHDIASRAVGSHRYRVTYRGPGGHSYLAFGIPNPIHALGRAIADIADIQVRADPKTTFNVGTIHGGTSVNSISASASMDVDLRSESAAALQTLDDTVRAILDRALAAENGRWTGPAAERARLSLAIDTIGIRPTGTQADTAPIVRAAVAAGRALGMTPATTASSTDANWPISLGIPAVRIGGGGSSEGAHSLAEWYDDGSQGWLGPQWAALLVATLAGTR